MTKLERTARRPAFDGRATEGSRSGSAPLPVATARSGKQEQSRPVTLTLYALDRIRTAILEGRFKPGDRLTERRLCELTGGSRTVVREALRRLEAEGLIESIPNCGPSVSRVTADEIRQIFQVRVALEGPAIQQFAVRATAKEIQALSEAYERIETTHQNRDFPGFIAATNIFYDIILGGSGNKVIQSIANSLKARLTYLRLLALTRSGRGPDSIESTRRIVNALKMHDAQASRDALVQHLAIVESNTLEALRRLQSRGRG